MVTRTGWSISDGDGPTVSRSWPVGPRAPPQPASANPARNAAIPRPARGMPGDRTATQESRALLVERRAPGGTPRGAPARPPAGTPARGRVDVRAVRVDRAVRADPAGVGRGRRLELAGGRRPGRAVHAGLARVERPGGRVEQR